MYRLCLWAAPIALLVGALCALAPALALVLGGLVAVILFPSVGIYLAVFLDSTRLATTSLGVDSGTLTLGVGGVAMLSVLGHSLRRGEVARRILSMTTFLAIAAIAGVTQSLLSAPPSFLLVSLNLLVAPLLAGLVLGHFSSSRLLQFAKGICLLLALNALAAIYAYVVGVEELLRLTRTEYGTTVREIDGIIRAPGLMLSNASAGLFAASTGVYLLTMHATGLRLSRTYRFTATASIAAILILSTSRSAVMLLAVTMAMYFVLGRSQANGRGAEWVRPLGFGAAVALPVALLQYGASSVESVFARVQVWTALIEQFGPVVGSGAGRVGAASYSDASPYSPVFVDNSWLSLALQYGLLGIAITVLGAVLLWRRASSLADTRRRWLIRAILVSTGLTAVFIEILDYPTTVLLLAASITCCLRQEVVSGCRLENVEIKKLELVPAVDRDRTSA